ncbi:MurR/RpiR family transcriptional regulator [Halanaerobium saccharolyticum]|jgi:DNA-binding MurR/RpiR family transcriptional regulator|uniref:RpiR family transcriptional regulator n=1 Tax=Halanaerobium saccharolyticum TaxID=43595 RepID=A0A4R6SEP8_9FIRM|nr:MurR/RpiR family transcriptional regulator [Halanaerobium saccharolyticum]TDP98204.1 RpiR family transcriptional regulator [Halanaerobium saccharolyticum]
MNQKKQNVLPKIRSEYNSLPPSEVKVADYVLQNPEEIIYLSVSELATEVDVSDSTIIRFCKDVGFKGYQEFKLFIAQDLVVTIEDINEDISENDDLETLSKKITFSNKQAIEETMSVLDLDALKAAIDKILNSDKIQFYGVGASGITACDAKYKFLRIGKNVDCYTDAHLQAMSAATLGENDLVVGISHSGSTKDVVDSCRIAREAGATVICITGHNKSPITRVSDIKLLTATKEGPLGSGALRSKIAQLHMLDLIFTGVSLKQKEKTIKFTEKTAKAVIDKLY